MNVLVLYDTIYHYSVCCIFFLSWRVDIKTVDHGISVDIYLNVFAAISSGIPETQKGLRKFSAETRETYPTPSRHPPPGEGLAPWSLPRASR